MNNLKGSQAATVVNNKAVIYGTNGELNASKLQVSGVDITATPAEINKLDGVLASTAQINHLVGVSGPIQTQLDNKLSSSDIANLYAPKEGVNTITTVGALNAGSITAGFGSIDTGSSTITTTGKVTAGELEVDNVVVSGSTIGVSGDTDLLSMSSGVLTVNGNVNATKLLVGGTEITATPEELNALKGVTATKDELNILDGATVTTSELNILDGVTATKDELNILAGAAASTIVNSKAVVYGANGEINASKLQLSGTDITATAANINAITGLTAEASDLNKLDGLTTTALELGYLAGVTSSIQTQLSDRYTKAEADAAFAASSTGNQNQGGNFTTGSIGIGFGTINTNESITTSDTLSGGKLEIDDIVINNSNIGFSGDQDLITLSNNSVAIAGTVNSTTVETITLKLSNTQVTSTAEELNLLDGATVTTDEINILDGVTANKDEINLLDGAVADTVVNGKAVVYGTSGEVKATSLDSGSVTVGTMSIGAGSINDSSGTLVLVIITLQLVVIL